MVPDRLGSSAYSLRGGDPLYDRCGHWTSIPALTSGDGTSVDEEAEGWIRARRASSESEDAANEVPYLEGRISGSKAAECDGRNPAWLRSPGFGLRVENDGGVSGENCSSRTYRASSLGALLSVSVYASLVDNNGAVPESITVLEAPACRTGVADVCNCFLIDSVAATRAYAARCSASSGSESGHAEGGLLFESIL